MPNREVEGIDVLEGFGISFIEASACEKPIIGGKSGGAGEAILDGVTGYLLDLLDINDLSDKIIKLLKEGDLAREMGKKGRQRAVKDFQWVDRVEAVKNTIS